MAEGQACSVLHGGAINQGVMNVNRQGHWGGNMPPLPIGIAAQRVPFYDGETILTPISQGCIIQVTLKRLLNCLVVI